MNASLNAPTLDSVLKGKRVDNGELMTVRLSSQEMFEALEEPTAHLLAAVCEAIGEIPSQFVGEIFHRGILLCGGGSCPSGEFLL